MSATNDATSESGFTTREHSCSERIADQLASRADDVRKMLAAQTGAVCVHCGAQLEEVTEEHATYWSDLDGDSLSYVPSLHDHEPDPNYDEDSLGGFGLGLSRKVVLRFDMSTGGPADWLEILCDEDTHAERGHERRDGYTTLTVESVTYHFADWFDHAEQVVEEGSPLFELAEWIAEVQS